MLRLRLKLLLADQVLIQMGLPTLGFTLSLNEVLALFFAAFPFSCFIGRDTASEAQEI